MMKGCSRSRSILSTVLAASVVVSLAAALVRAAPNAVWPNPGAGTQGGTNRIDACGRIDVDTTWTPGNVYVITCEVTVAEGATLTVMPGTVVKAYYGNITPGSITVRGRLVAEGTVDAPVVFTSIKDDEHGGDTNADGAATVPGPGDWQSLNFEAGSSGRIANALIAYGGKWFFYANEALVRCADADIRLDHVTLRASYRAGLSAMRCSAEVTHGTMAANASGVEFAGLAAGAPFTLANNTFGPGAAGVVLFDGSAHGLVSIRDNVAVDGKTGLNLRGTLNGEFDWDNNALVLLLVEGLTVAPEATLHLVPGSVVKSSLLDPGGIAVNGTLLAEGTPEAPIVFTSLQDDGHGGDTNADGPSAGVPGQWASVTVNTGGVAQITHAEILYGGGYTFFQDSRALVRATGGEVTIEDVTLGASAWSAIYAENGSVLVRDSRMEGNAWNVWNHTPQFVVDARFNWWGDASGPRHQTKNPNGLGKDVTDGVLFFPWAIDPDGTVPSRVHVTGPSLASPGETVDYSVEYFAGDAIDNAVLVLTLPRTVRFVDATPEAIFWEKPNAAFWKLGNLATGSEGQMSLRLLFDWGIPRGSTGWVWAELAGTNTETTGVDVRTFLDYAPVALVAEEELSEAEIAMERGADIELDVQCQAAETAGAVLGGATRYDLADGRTVFEMTYLEQTQPAVRFVRRSGTDTVSTTYESTGIKVQTSEGGALFDVSIGTVQPFDRVGARARGRGEQAEAPQFVSGCLVEAGVDLTVGNLGKILSILAKPDCVRCVLFKQKEFCPACRESLKQELKIQNAPVIGDLAALTECLAKALGALGVSYPCTHDLWVCDLGLRGKPLEGKVAAMLIPCQEGKDKQKYLNFGATPSIHRCLIDHFTEERQVCRPGPDDGSKRYGCAWPCDLEKPSTRSRAAVSDSAETCAFFETHVRTAKDPNAKAGPAGDVIPGQIVPYKVEFENEGEGTAYGVYVTDELSPHLDETTLELNGQGDFSPVARTILWEIGELAPKGQEGSKGERTFTVAVKSGLPSGTVITNQAVVYFPSVPEETATNTVVNVVQPLAAVPQSLETPYGISIAVTLAGRDVSGETLTYSIAEQPLAGKLTGTAPDLIYTPAENFTGQDRFTFTVSNEVSESRAADVTILVTPSSADTFAPEVLWTYPAGGAVVEAVPADPVAVDETGPLYAPSVLAAFSEAMNPATITDATMRLNTGAGHDVQAALLWDGTGNQAVLVPREAWQDGSYTATVTTGVRDASGNELAAEYAWSFRIGAAPTACTGDCNENGNVTVEELIKGVNIALGSATIDRCPLFDKNGNGAITVDELVTGVNNALGGCVAPPPTATLRSSPTASVAAPTRTRTATPTVTSTPSRAASHTPMATNTSAPSPSATLTVPPPSTTPTVTRTSQPAATSTATRSPSPGEPNTPTPPFLPVAQVSAFYF